jgi:outer membrane putative beta-barrel porin/alpha-amylase
VSSAPALRGQDLAPRAYVITPVRSNAVTMAYSYNDGNLLIEGAVPITGATGRISGPWRTTTRSAFSAARPTSPCRYGVGTFEGTALGEQRSIYRSGLFDSVFRFSVNLAGGPAMSLAKMRQWRQKTLLGFSLKVTAPTGQYDPTKLINRGTNRWAFKPELGLSQGWGHWVLDEPGRRGEPRDPPEELPRRCDRRTPLQPTSVAEGRLRSGRLRAVRGRLQVASAAWQYSWVGEPR